MQNNPEFHLHQGLIYRLDKYNHPSLESDIMNTSKKEKCQYGMPRMKFNENW